MRSLDQIRADLDATADCEAWYATSQQDKAAWRLAGDMRDALAAVERVRALIDGMSPTQLRANLERALDGA